MKIRGIIFLVAILLISSALAYALSPSITINTSPGTSVDTTVIISSYSYDPDQSGLQSLSIYEDGILNNSINCLSQQSCSIANTFVHGKSNHTYYAVAIDATNNIVTSNIIAVTFVGLNTPPNFISPLPNITLAEDSGLTFNLTDLWNFADDAHTIDSSLTFAITSQSNVTLATCAINSNRFVQCNTTGQNISGTSLVNYSVTDQAVGLSPAFTNTSYQLITIMPLNDPPMLTNITLPFIEVVEDSSNTSINLSNHFYDIDSPLTFSLINNNPNILVSLFNSTLLNVTSINNFTGNSSLTIIASDGSLSINITRNITVLPFNDPPFFNPLLINKTGSTDNLFTYNITASDVDSTNLAFFDNTTLFNISSLGLINFTPTAMANETILITVCDDSNALNNCTSSSFRLIISDITPPISGNITEPLDPSIFNQSLPYQFNISLSDPAGIGNVSFTIGSTTITTISNLSGVFTATIPILGAGTYNYRWTFSDTQGNANNTQLFNFTVFPANSSITLFLNGSNSNLLTTLGSRPNASVSLTGPVNEFVNYFVNNTLVTTALQNTTIFFSNSSTCFIGTCNVTATFPGNQNFTASSSTLTVTFIDAASPIFSTIIASPSSPTTYSTSINYLFSTNVFDDVAVRSVVFNLNGVNMIPNQSSSLYSINFANLSAGNYTITWFANDTSGNQNTTSFIYTINQAVPVISLTSSPVPPYSFGQNSSIACSVNTPEVTLVFTRNGTIITSPDNTANLAAGIYNYACSNAQTQNFTASSQSTLITVNKASPVLSLTLNNLPADIFVQNGTLVTMDGNLTLPTNDFIELYLDGSLLANATNTVSNTTNFTLPGNYNSTINFAGNQNFTAASLTRFIIVGSPVAKFNFNPASLSLLNNSFVFISFDTNPAAVCRYSFADLPFSSMTNTFTTTGAINHSGTVSGLTLGLNNIHIACSNDTATTNADLVYNVTNILDNSTITNVNTTNSIITFSIANELTAFGINATQTNLLSSILTNVTAMQSTINNSILTNCIVINSTVKGYSASNCQILNSVVDPVTTSNLTGSNISADSTVMNSNVTYSNVVNSTITNSDIDRSTITNAVINNTLITNSIITNSQLSNTTVVSATIINNIISNGTIRIFNGSLYNATLSGSASLSSLINVPPTVSFTINPNPTIIGSTTDFSSTSTDANIGGPLNDSITSYFWNFGDGSNATGSFVNHTYTSTGTFAVNLTVTDSYGESTSSNQQASINSPSVPPSGGGGGGGGGGGAGGGFGSRLRIKLSALPVGTIVGTRYIVTFDFNGVLYTTKFDRVSSQGAALSIIPPDPAAIYAAPTDVPIRINLDGDETYDLRLLVTEYQYGRIKAFFTLINESVHPPAPIFPEIIEQPVVKQPEPQKVEQPPLPAITGASVLDQIPINKKDALIGTGVIIGLGLILFLGRALQMFGLRRLLFRLKVFGFRRAFRL